MRVPIIVALLMPTCLHAQVISLQFNDGATINFVVPDLRSADMGTDQFHAFLWDGTTYAWDLAAIKNMRFADIPTGLEVTPVVLAPLRIYPVPSTGVVQIGFNLQVAGSAIVEIRDQRGGLVHTARYADLSSGAHTVTWGGKGPNDQEVAAGIYFCRISMGPLQVSQKIVMEH